MTNQLHTKYRHISICFGLLYIIFSQHISTFPRNRILGDSTVAEPRLKLRYARSGRFGRGLLRAFRALRSLLSLRLSREPYATARQFA